MNGRSGRPPWHARPPRFLLVATLAATACAAPAPPESDGRRIVDQGLLDQLLRDHVRLGLVDYARLKEDGRLGAYVNGLAESHPSPADGRRGQLAYWINAYNAFVLHAVCSRYPIGSVREIGEVGGAVDGLFEGIEFPVAGSAYTLDVIEHKILRPEFKEARIHFALAPGTRGGARLRSAAYHPGALEAELEEAARAFIDDASKVRLIRKDRKLELSPLFDWFSEDFGRGKAPIVEYLKRYLPPADTAFLQYAEVDVRYLEYDWSLNDQASRRPAVSPP